MVIAFKPEEMSTEVVVEIFKKGLAEAAAGSIFALEDPIKNTRRDKSRFVVTSIPNTDVEYPHIVVEENDVTGGRLDTRQSKLMAFKFQLLITIRAVTNTQIFPIKDGVREWLQKDWEAIKDAGFADLTIQGQGKITWDPTSQVKEFRMIVNGNVYTTGE